MKIVAYNTHQEQGSAWRDTTPAKARPTMSKRTEAEVLLRHDLHVDDVTIILSVGDQGGPATIVHPPSSLNWLTAALPHDVFVIALEADLSR